MNIKKSIIFHIFLFIVAILVMIPLIVLVGTSLKTEEAVMFNPEQIFPKQPTLSNFIYIINEFNFLKYAGNTLFIVVIATLGTVFSCAFVGFGFIRYDVKVKTLIFAILFGSAMIPGQVLQIPIYETFHRLGWIDTYFPFIIPPIFGGGIFNVFLVMQFFRGIPLSTYESAEIDGANDFKIFLKFVLPLSVPVLLAISIFTILANWNDFFGPLIYLNSQSKYTLALAVYEIIYYNNMNSTGGSTKWNFVAAANIITMIPILIVYAFGAKLFVTGIDFSGGLKG